MKAEQILQILNLLTTLVIGVVVTMHLGKFNYRKKNKEELITTLIALNQSLGEFQSWHRKQISKLINYRILKTLKDYSKYSDNWVVNESLIEEYDQIFSLTFKSHISKIYDFTGELEENLEISPFFYTYKGTNPLFQLELLSLKLNSNENKKLESTFKKIKEEVNQFYNRFQTIVSIIDDYEFKNSINNSINETKEVIYNWQMGFITKLEASDQVTYILISSLVKIENSRKDLLVGYYKASDLTSEFKKYVLKL